MKQLSGIDASFLYMESPQTPMHVAGVTLYERPAGLKGSFHAHFLKFFKERLHLIPIFNKKLAKTVFEIDHPGWVDAGDIDFDYHIRKGELPKPGTFEQLEAFVGELHSEPLDLKKPLWQFTIIENLESGLIALYSKVHHAAIDGGGGMAVAQALYDLTPVPRQVKPPETDDAPTRVPSKAERAILGAHDLAANLVNQQLSLMEAIPKTMNQMVALTASALSGGLGMPQLVAPKTAFNGTIGQKRSYCGRDISLADVKAIAKATDSKVNDIVLAICSGALRRYLDQKHKLPDASLTAFVPISTRTGSSSDNANQVFGMNCALATNYSKPLKRLEKIKQDTATSKAFAGSVQELSPTDFTILGAPMLLPALMNMYGRSGLADVIPNSVNVTVSNTAGPPIPLFCAGAKVAALYPVSIPIHGIGLNLTVISYMDKMFFGLTGDHASVPDIAHLGDLLVDSFEELKKLTLTEKKNPTE